jgi:hypothetical protein
VDCGHPNGLRDVAFADAGIAKHEYVLALLDEARGSEVEDERAIKAGIEAPIKRVEGLRISKTGGLNTARNEAIATTFEFVVDEQSQEVEWSKVIGSGLLSTHFKNVGHAAQPELP